MECVDVYFAFDINVLNLVEWVVVTICLNLFEYSALFLSAWTFHHRIGQYLNGMDNVAPRPNIN